MNKRYRLKDIIILQFPVFLLYFFTINQYAKAEYNYKLREVINEKAVKKNECITVIDSLKEPVFVYSEKTLNEASIIYTLDNLSIIEVENNQNGWIEIKSPVRGWVPLQQTHATCGWNGIKPSLERISKLFKKAQNGNFKATDMLVRFSYQDADGAMATIVNGYLLQLSKENPKLLISVLDDQPENERLKILTDSQLIAIPSIGNKNDSFEKELKIQRASLTSKTVEVYKKKLISSIKLKKPRNSDLVSDSSNLRLSYNIEQRRIYYSDTTNINMQFGDIEVTKVIRNVRDEVVIVKGLFQDKSPPRCKGTFYLERHAISRYVSSWTITGGDNFKECPPNLNFKINLKVN